MSAKINEKLWRLGMKNALVVGLVMLMACVVLAGVISFFTPLRLGGSLGLAFDLLFAAVIFLSFASSAWGRTRAGSLLLDAGAHPMRRLFLFIVFAFLISAMTSALSPVSGGIFFSAFMPYIYFAGAVFFLYMSFGRLQIREAGIWEYWGLLPWEKIASYTWTKDDNVIIQTTGWFSFRRGGFAVPPEHKATFERYLLERTRQQAQIAQ